MKSTTFIGAVAVLATRALCDVSDYCTDDYAGYLCNQGVLYQCQSGSAVESGSCSADNSTQLYCASSNDGDNKFGGCLQIVSTTATVTTTVFWEDLQTSAAAATATAA